MTRRIPLRPAVPVILAVALLATGCDKIRAVVEKVRPSGKSGATVPTEPAPAPGSSSYLLGGEVHSITGTQFPSLINDPHRLVVVDFYADWCGPCRQLAPVMASLANEFPVNALFLKVDVDKNRPLAAKLGVKGIPDIRMYKAGEMVEQVVGALPLEPMRQKVSSHTKGLKPIPRDAAPAAEPVAPAPATTAEDATTTIGAASGLLDKLRKAMPGGSGAGDTDATPAASGTGGSGGSANQPGQPVPIRPIKANEEWLPAGMGKGQAPPAAPKAPAAN